LRFGRNLGIQFFLNIVIVFFEVFRYFIDFFGCFRRDGRGKRQNISRFNRFFTFVIGWGFGNLRIKFGFDLVFEQCLGIIYIEAIPV